MTKLAKIFCSAHHLEGEQINFLKPKSKTGFANSTVFIFVKSTWDTMNFL